MKPNVLLICVDHWPGPLLRAAGNKHIFTHTLDQFSENGILFSRAYSSTPTCIPARRAIMTGTTARTHGDRIFNEHLKMCPDLPTMPQVFRDAGYQAYAVGKMHVYPQRDRIGFDEIILNEEGRHHLGLGRDDYELFLSDQGYAGQELTHGAGNNDYMVRAWHLPEYCHPTYWTTKQMCRFIQRRDPTRPAFWYCSYSSPHPPITPPSEYLDLYREAGVDKPFIGDWAKDCSGLPYALKRHMNHLKTPEGPDSVSLIRKGFYAQCTYIDQQIRLIIGTLREEGLLDDTIVMFISDHGDMLGNHGLWAKPPMFEYSARIPMILMPTPEQTGSGYGVIDDRLAELRDVMPTLLELCGIDIPKEVEGFSLVSGQKRDYLYCEHFDGDIAMRMVTTGKHKLIYYPVGNRFQLFDMKEDPLELRDESDNPSYSDTRIRLTQILMDNLYGEDLEWITEGRLTGKPDKEFIRPMNRGLSAQRGWR